MTTYELYLILLNYLSKQPDGESMKAILLELYKITEKSPTVKMADKEHEVEIATRGNCMMCGKELDEGLFFCKECEAKAESEDEE